MITRKQDIVFFLIVHHLIPLTLGCPQMCKCDLEGRGMRVVCEGGDLDPILSGLPQNTQRIVISGLTTQTLTQENLLQQDLPTSIISMTVTHSALQEIHTGVFATTLASVEDLDLSANNIRVLAPGAFSGLSRLKSLSLSSNHIDDLNTSLEPLVSLQKLDLSTNSITELKPSLFKSQSNLVNLRLDHNPFHHLEAEAFKPLTFLTELRVRDCGIFNIEEAIFSYITRVQVLDLGDNRLHQFPSSTSFTQLRYLKYLYLDGNEFLALQKHQFADLSLITLSLARIRLSTINAEVMEKLTVEELDLSDNKLLELKGSSLLPVAPHLASLNVSGNPIRMLNVDSFKGLHLLQAVNISSCSLTDLPASTFTGLVHLRQLDASFNHLQNISENMIKIFKRMNSVNLQRNPWLCDCHIMPLRNWLLLFSTQQKLTCLPGQLGENCTNFQCTSPDKLSGQAVGSLDDADIGQCNKDGFLEGLPIAFQVVIVVACLLFSFVVLGITFLLWRRGHTKHQLKHVLDSRRNRKGKIKTKKKKKRDEDEEVEEKIEPFKDCDNESLKESHRSFLVRHYFDTLVTDPTLLEPTSPSGAAPSRQQDSMYSSDPDLYEASQGPGMMLGIESTV